MESNNVFSGKSTLDMLKSAVERHIELYRWRRDIPWDIHTCEEFARRGDLECLKYASHYGCPWGKTVEEAALHGNVNCLAYALEGDWRWSNREKKIWTEDEKCALYLIDRGYRNIGLGRFIPPRDPYDLSERFMQHGDDMSIDFKREHNDFINEYTDFTEICDVLGNDLTGVVKSFLLFDVFDNSFQKEKQRILQLYPQNFDITSGKKFFET
jgi:hypothetical protein